MCIYTGWCFFATPLKNDGVRQLGWWNSQYDGKVIKFHGSSHHQPVYIMYSSTVHIPYHPMACSGGSSGAEFALGFSGKMETRPLPSGKLTVCYWKWPICSWFTHQKWWCSIVIHSYVSLPEGNHHILFPFTKKSGWWNRSAGISIIFQSPGSHIHIPSLVTGWFFEIFGWSKVRNPSNPTTIWSRGVLGLSLPES